MTTPPKTTIEWTPERLRNMGSTVRTQAWPIADQVKDALYSAAEQIEQLEIPAPQDMHYYRLQAQTLIGFARCGYLDQATYRKLVKVLSESLAETAMVLQEFSEREYETGNQASEGTSGSLRSEALKANSNSEKGIA